MNREIKFRGLSESGSGWKYGYLFLTRFTNTHQTGLVPVIQVINDTDDGYNGFRVYEKSICQFTGLLDSNRKEIYEGDILKFTTIFYSKEDYFVCKFTNGGFNFFTKSGLIKKVDTTIYSVIGNIHEHSNLILR